MGIVEKAKKIGGQAASKAKEISGQVHAKANEIAGDDLIAEAIVRAADKLQRVNTLLEGKGCAWRIDGIEVENGIPPKAVFILGPAPESK